MPADELGQRWARQILDAQTGLLGAGRHRLGRFGLERWEVLFAGPAGRDPWREDSAVRAGSPLPIPTDADRLPAGGAAHAIKSHLALSAHVHVGSCRVRMGAVGPSYLAARGIGNRRGREAMTVREQETLLRALDLWQAAVGNMTWEERANAALALLIVRDDEIDALRRRIQRGEVG